MAENDADRNKNRRPKDFLDWLGLSASPDWKVARPFGHFLSVVLALFFVLAFVAAFATLFRLVFGGNAGLGAGALVVAVLGAPFVIWNTYIRHRTLEFQKEGHITDRLAKAVEQLGTEKTVKTIVEDRSEEKTVPNIEVRIGGLLSLERIAQDSVAYDKGRDHVRVMEIICAYIRENAPARNAADYSDITAKQDGYYAEVWMGHVTPIRQDIMLALNILSRRTDLQRRIEAAHGRDDGAEADWPFVFPTKPRSDWFITITMYTGYRLDLRDTCLQGADLSSFALSGALLDRARLDRANMSGARLNGASLCKATLYEVILTGAQLNAARLAHTWIGRVINMDGVQLSAAQLKYARFLNANMSSARLDGASMHYALLWEVNLSDNKTLTNEQIALCFGDASVQLPPNIKRPTHWPDQSSERERLWEEYSKWLIDNYTPTKP